MSHKRERFSFVITIIFNLTHNLIFKSINDVRVYPSRDIRIWMLRLFPTFLSFCEKRLKNTDVEADDVVAGGGDVERERGTMRRRRRQTEVRAVTKQIGRRLSPSRDQERPRVCWRRRGSAHSQSDPQSGEATNCSSMVVRAGIRRSIAPTVRCFSPREN